MSIKRQQFGKAHEAMAAGYLKQQGYEILETNYRTRLGEIDIIAKDRQTLVFIEVKARSSNRFGSPKWAVTPKKQMKISMVALEYLKRTHQIRAKARFDVISIQAVAGNPQIELVKNAFELAFG
jgi:putative endonuclease